VPEILAGLLEAAAEPDRCGRDQEGELALARAR